jgi:MFS transporter, Spinster family, sphingosine-1-phosphate transporter
MFYAITCISAPILGVVVGGSIIHRVGGYNSPKAIKISCFVSLFAVASALPIPFTSNFLVFQILIWLLLFFGGFIVPVMTGILLTAVQAHERTIANSVANLSYNLLGYLPSPFVYGFVCSLTGGD